MWKRKLVLVVSSLRVETSKLHECGFDGNVAPLSRPGSPRNAHFFLGWETGCSGGVHAARIRVRAVAHTTSDLEIGATYIRIGSK
jgi:hypothetical protein